MITKRRFDCNNFMLLFHKEMIEKTFSSFSNASWYSIKQLTAKTFYQKFIFESSITFWQKIYVEVATNVMIFEIGNIL